MNATGNRPPLQVKSRFCFYTSNGATNLSVLLQTRGDIFTINGNTGPIHLMYPWLKGILLDSLPTH